jgi:acetylglutamate kinase
MKRGPSTTPPRVAARRTPSGASALSAGAAGLAGARTAAPVVVKVGGRVQADPRLAGAVAALWGRRPGCVVLVHGGGDEASALMRRLGQEPEFVGGRRVTSAGDIDTLRMALSGVANKRLVAALVSEGVRAVGLSGEDAGLIEATVALGGTLGRVGEPMCPNPSLLTHLLEGGFLPVVSPLARDAGAPPPGAALNVNADDAAAALARSLGAAELLLVSDVPAVLVDGRPAATLGADEARALIACGVAAGGMAAKLEAALAALGAGVLRVRVGDLDLITGAGRIGVPAPGTTLSLERSHA